jgi:hypothetical protein
MGKSIMQIINGIDHKFCKKCNKFYEFVDRYWMFESGKSPRCRECKKDLKRRLYHRDLKTHKERNKRWRDANKEYIKEKSKIYGIINKDKISAKNKERHEKKPELRKLAYKKDREKNLEKRKAGASKYFKARLATDPLFRLTQNLRRRILMGLKEKGNTKHANTLKLIGADSWSAVIKHIESQFQDGMSWDNHGFYGWHVDHKKPISSFDLSIPEQQLLAFNYTNLQPLWAKDNLSKGAKLDWKKNEV